MEPLPCIMKGVLKCSSHNPNAKAARNYSIVEYSGQTPCVMSYLEVLQMCPSQRNTFLSTLGALDSCGSKVIKFDFTSTYDQICHGFSLLLPHLSVAISTKAKTIFRRYIHEPGVRGNNDEIISPRVITIKIG
jgi:hypothetical protein